MDNSLVMKAEMGEMITTFYKNLYTSEGTTDMNVVLDTVAVKVSTMNEGLIAPFSKHNVKETLFQMFPMNALGSDGFPTHFFSATRTCAVLM